MHEIFIYLYFKSTVGVRKYMHGEHKQQQQTRLYTEKPLGVKRKPNISNQDQLYTEKTDSHARSLLFSLKLQRKTKSEHFKLRNVSRMGP